MQTTFLKVLGVTLIAATTVQMAGAAEHHARRHRATALQQEQFRNSNAYYAAPDFRAPDSFAMWPRAWPEQDEAAMSSGIAGH